MNPRDVMQMEAGRELDALVAERVMGQAVTWVTFTGETFCFVDDEYGEGAAGAPLPRYSTDISAAWQVVEWMHGRGWRVSLHNRASGPWACHIVVWPGDAREWADLATAPTAQVAICRASLLACAAAPAEENRR